jgi:hypothetical protein
MPIKSEIKNHLSNIPGYRTKRKIVVFESDDWGSIRTPHLLSLDKLRSEGLPVEKCLYMMNDSLESIEDLTALFQLLQKFNDKKGNSPIFTANTIVANPNFEKIEASDFNEYFHETFIETYQRYFGNTKVFDAFKEGISRGVFYPQLHGREHLNISRWMKDLKGGVFETRLAFDLKMTGVSAHITKTKRGSYQAAFDGGLEETIFDKSEILRDAAGIFKDVFGFQSKSFIAPNYVWNDTLENVAAQIGIEYLQGSSSQRLPSNFGDPIKTQRHYTGTKSRNGLIYLVRNASFEPSLLGSQAVVESCMNELSTSFLWGKPAIITTHRVNYVGGIQEQNRTNSLKLLETLIGGVLKKWPDVEFMSTVQLGDVIKNG